MRSKLFAFCILFATLHVQAQVYELSSPDGKLKATINVGDQITYSLTHEATQVLSASPISMTLQTGEVLGRAPRGATARRTSVNQTIPSPFYKKSQVVENYNQLTVTFRGDYGIIFRAYNEGFAYRFTTSRRGDLVITNEEFTLNFPKDYLTYSPYSGAGEGTFEHQLRNSFEGLYTRATLSNLDTARLIYLPMLVELDDGKKLCVAEVDLWGFPGTFFNSNGAQTLTAVHAGYPKSSEPRERSVFILEHDDFIAKSVGTRVFPWRLFVVANNASELLDSDLVYVIAEPSRLADVSWIKPGKSAWDWGNGGILTGVDFRSGMNTETFKHYIDFAAKHGLEHVLVDEGWAVDRDNILAGVVSTLDFDELVRYGRSKNVDIQIWMSYRVFHHDMENIARHFSSMGIKGFKVDFMDRNDQEITDFVYEAAEICAKYKLLLNLHGVYAPTGLQRTLPNVITYEGVLGAEWAKFGDQRTVLQHVVNDVTFPFIRMVAGPADYTPGGMLNASRQNFRIVFNEPMTPGTRCRQLAMFIVFHSPMTVLLDRPSYYEREPECINFIAKIPTVWDETVPLENSIAEYVSVARRSGNEWFIGGISNWSRRELTLDLSFLGEGNYKAELFTDGMNADRIASDYKREIIDIPADRKLTVRLVQGGGFAARIYK